MVPGCMCGALLMMRGQWRQCCPAVCEHERRRDAAHKELDMATIPQEKTDKALAEIETSYGQLLTQPADDHLSHAVAEMLGQVHTAFEALRDEIRGKLPQRVPPGNGVE